MPLYFISFASVLNFIQRKAGRYLSHCDAVRTMIAFMSIGKTNETMVHLPLRYYVLAVANSYFFLFLVGT